MTAALTQARRIGARAVACASTGNTSASLAAYAAQAGIPAFVLVPEGHVSTGKLAQTLAYGAHMIRLRGDFDDCLELAREASEQLGIYLVNSINPFRVEGQKTIVLELLQQLGWESPDWIALPAGNLGNTAAFGKALREAHALGLIDRVPRLLAVQAAGAAPFAAGFARRLRHAPAVRAETAATAIRIGDPASWDRAVEAIRFTKGHVVAVSDEEIFAAKRVIDRVRRRLRAGERGERGGRAHARGARRSSAATSASSPCSPATCSRIPTPHWPRAWPGASAPRSHSRATKHSGISSACSPRRRADVIPGVITGGFGRNRLNSPGTATILPSPIGEGVAAHRWGLRSMGNDREAWCAPCRNSTTTVSTGTSATCPAAWWSTPRAVSGSCARSRRRRLGRAVSAA